MQTIYRPTGKALEYSDLALNLYRGCDHFCTYCFSPKMLHMTREKFNQPMQRPVVVEEVERIAGKYAGQCVFLCFSCDPYQKIDVDLQLTRQAIKVLHAADVTVRILTKGGLRSTREFDILGPGDAYGATLTFLDDQDSLRWEPGAALPHERLGALKAAHAEGIYTWASLEPVIDPLQSFEILLSTYEYIDEYKIGKWNYDKRANEIDYGLFVRKAVEFLKSKGKKFYIKKDLQGYLK